MTIYDHIVNFKIIAKYVPRGFDENTAPALNGMGPSQNILPVDRNATFFFTYTSGQFTQM
jgi:hypothetical protein